MPYVKLDCGILDSTVWLNTDARSLFLTALLMATPREFDEPVETFEIDRNEPTGWQAPAGWYGFIEAAGPGIIRRAMLGIEPGMRALRGLCDPDPESRSPANEGRRLARVKGGYIVLNFMEYRDRDYTMAERARRYRQRKMGKDSVTDVTRDSVTSRRNVTQSESESESLRIMKPVDNVNNGDNSTAAQRNDVRHKALVSPTGPPNGKEAEANKAWALLCASDGKIKPAAVQAAIEAIPGGWSAIQKRTPETEPVLRAQFVAALSRATAH